MLRIGICDDNEYIAFELDKYISEYNKLQNLNIETDVFYSGERIIQQIKNLINYDLIFLDIEMGGMNGIEVGKQIRNRFDNYYCKIVFITGNDGYEQKLFEIQPFNFIKKPIAKDKIFDILSLAIKLNNIDNQIFSYKKSFDVFRVSLRNILYFEKKGNKIKIVTMNSVDYFYDTLSNIKKSLPEIFVETHGSYLVNFNKISSLKRAYLQMANGDMLPVSQRNLSSIRNIMIEYERSKIWFQTTEWLS